MKVTVSYPVTFDTDEIDDFEENSLLDKRNLICDFADKILESSPPSPVITDCDDPDLIEHDDY